MVVRKCTFIVSSGIAAFAFQRVDLASNGVNSMTPKYEARRFMVDCLKAVGTPAECAQIVAANLLEADYRGHYSHGMNKLEMYVRDVQLGQTDPCAHPLIVKQSCSTALVDGQNGFGAVVGKFCMDLAIQKAKKSGIGMVVAYGSNHYGIAGIYAFQAIKDGCIGISCTNSSPFLVPTRAKEAALGKNPIALGAPGECGDYLLVDMSSTAVSLAKIEAKKNKCKPIPPGWALNNQGLTETNAEIAYSSKRLTPLGGCECNSGYKGYGLAMIVEVLSGILSGSAYGPNIRKWGEHDTPANLGHCFIAIDHKQFACNFEGRMEGLMSYLRNMPSVDPNLPVLVHGDKERAQMALQDKYKGIIYPEKIRMTCNRLAEELKVKPMESRCYY